MIPAGIVAKKYVDAIINLYGEDSLEGVRVALSNVMSAFDDSEFRRVMRSPLISNGRKLHLLLAVSGSRDEYLNRTFEIMVHKGRAEVIPFVFEKLDRLVNLKKGVYSCEVLTKHRLKQSELDEVLKLAGNKLGVGLGTCRHVTGFDGICLRVDELGVELSFSRDRFANNLKKCVLQAI